MSSAALNVATPAAEQAVGADRPSASFLKIRNSGGRSTAALGVFFVFFEMRFQRQLILSLILIGSTILWSCAESEKSNVAQVQKPKANTIVLSYDDFGPQVVSHEQIGMGWYQWNSQGPDDPNARDDVKVVVYRNISPDEVKRMYPVIEEKQDYRYLEYQLALSLLKQYEQDPFWNDYKETKDRARQTREKILAQLGT